MSRNVFVRMSIHSTVLERESYIERKLHRERRYGETERERVSETKETYHDKRLEAPAILVTDVGKNSINSFLEKLESLHKQMGEKPYKHFFLLNED